MAQLCMGVIFIVFHYGLWASLVAQTVKRLPTRQETQVLSLGGADPLEKEMATHSSTLAWKIPWTEGPDRLQSTGLRRVGQDEWDTTERLHFTSLLFHYGLLQDIECSSPCYPVGPCYLTILYIIVCIC